MPENPREQSLFLKACRGESTERTPVWFMRQAGRYMKEYQAVRDKISFLELCKNKDLCAEVAVTAAERLDVDAAILFSDILLILEPLGFQISYGDKNHKGISVEPIQLDDVKSLPTFSTQEKLPFVFDAVRQTRKALKDSLPLLGFSGAPFTLASYLIEGGGSKHYLKTKQWMRNEPAAWDQLMNAISDAVTDYLLGQIDAGVDAIQLFDSWVGCLSPSDYKTYVLPYTKKIFDSLGARVPTIHFGTSSGNLLPLMKQAGGNVIGVDAYTELDQAWHLLGSETQVQGNLDPTVLFSDIKVVIEEAEKILNQAAAQPGHIFNLGHGILPETPVSNVIALTKFVKEYSAAQREKVRV